jgi:hypothetical protein
MSEYMRYIDDDQQCADLDFIHNIYAPPNKKMATYDATNKFIIEGMEKKETNNTMFVFVSVFIVVLIFIYTHLKCNKIK